jgi:hypothetical protein
MQKILAETEETVNNAKRITCLRDETSCLPGRAIWLSSIQASEVLIQLVKIVRKICRFCKVIQKQLCDAHMFYLPCSSSSCHH